MTLRTPAAVVVALLLIAGCLPVPLGDPEKSKLDARYTGVWEWRDAGVVNLAVFRPYDGRTWAVDVLTAEPGEGAALKPVRRSTFKAWLTTVKAETFLTMAPLDTVSLLPGESRQKVFLVARVRVDGDMLTARGVDPKYAKLKDVGTATELERIVAANLDDVDLYVKTLVATKWPEDQTPRLEKILEDFAKWK
jgi:hypothetical protein